MRFEFYHAALDDVPKLSVDGTVTNSIHFSHWEGNQTPVEVKADTSTEIALNVVAAPNKRALTRGIELVTNNHFDTDGVLSVWTMLTGERACALRDTLVPAAEAGDFSEFTNENAIRASIAIQGSDQASANDITGSPLAHYLSAEGIVDDARAYELVLPEVERLLTKTDAYESLWRSDWERIAAAVDSFERGSSQVVEYAEASLSLITLSPEVFSTTGFNPTRHMAPFTAISHYARGRLFLITTPLEHGWAYRIDYPYYSWAETVVRPRIERQDLTQIIAQLNQLEPNGHGSWMSDSREMTSAAKFLHSDRTMGTSMLDPEEVAKTFRLELVSRRFAVAGNPTGSD